MVTKELCDNICRFLDYMCHHWHADECELIFGDKWEHFWWKWKHNVDVDMEDAVCHFVYSLDEDNRYKLFYRAIHYYD